MHLGAISALVACRALKLSCSLFGWQRLEPLVAVVAAEQVVRVREADFLLLHYYLLFKKTDLVRASQQTIRGLALDGRLVMVVCWWC